MESTLKTCADCGKTAPAFAPGSCCGSFGRDAKGADVCVDCCGKRDAAAVAAAQPGRFNGVAWYATGKDSVDVTNWPGTLKVHARATPYRRGGAFYGTPQRRVYWTCEGNVRILKG